MPQRTLSESEYNAIKAHVLDAAPAGLKEADFARYVGPAMASAVGEAENSAEPLEGSALARFASGAWKMLNPSGIVSAVMHPVDTVTGLVKAQGAEFSKFNTAAKEGRDVEALGHLAAGVVPVIGPAAANAGERIASGDVAGGLGEGAGLVGAVETPRLVKGAATGVNRLATKVVDSPGAQQALGATSGAVVGAGAGHPYIGMAIGSKYGAPVIKSLAEGAQAVTGGAPSVATVLSDVDLARQEFAAGRLPKAVLDAVERKAAATAPPAAPVAAPATNAAPVSPPPLPPAAPAGGPPVAASAPDAVPASVPRGTVPLTPAKIANSLWTAARDAKVTMSPDENVAAFQAVKAGMSPADAIASVKAVKVPSEVSAGFDPAKGGELFHGTTVERLKDFGKQSQVYLTTTPDEASGYAQGLHAPGESRGTPTVVKMTAKPGPTWDITKDISEAMQNDEFDEKWLDQRLAWGRQTGARYVTYDHPSFSGEGEQKVVVALHPAQDLVPTASAPSAAKAALTAPEVSLMQKLRAAGKSDAEITTAIQANRAFMERFNLKPPSEDATRFPKGMRGKPAGSE